MILAGLDTRIEDDHTQKAVLAFSLVSLLESYHRDHNGRIHNGFLEPPTCKAQDEACHFVLDTPETHETGFWQCYFNFGCENIQI